MEREVKFGDLENIVLNAVWAIEEENKRTKIDVKTVMQRVNKSHKQNWAYTTVKTVLHRLSVKKFLKETLNGKKNLYSSVVSRKKAGEKAVIDIAQLYFRNNYNAMIQCAQKFETAKVPEFKTSSPAAIESSECA